MSSDDVRPDGEGRLLTKKPVWPGSTVKLFLERVALPNGRVAELEIVHHPGAACVVPFVSDDDVLLVRQYRWAASGWLLEAPAGKLDAGEAPDVCARRELEEETGHVAGVLEPLGAIFPTPGFCDERIHLFVARQLTPGQQATEPDEVLSVQRVAFADALAMVADGRIQDGKTIAALLIAARRLGR